MTASVVVASAGTIFTPMTAMQLTLFWANVMVFVRGHYWLVMAIVMMATIFVVVIGMVGIVVA